MSTDHTDLSIINRAKEDDVKFVQLQFTDINGNIKAVTIPAERFPESIEKGIWFDGSSIEGFTRICESDMYLKPDISTYALLPGKRKRIRPGSFATSTCLTGLPLRAIPATS